MNTFNQIIAICLLTLFSVACQNGGTPEMAMTPASDSSSEGMLQHNVYFYLNDDVTDEEKAQFEEGLKELLTIEEIYMSEIGVPGSTAERDVTDHSFAYSIFTWFETLEDYGVYEDHPVHLDFIEKYNHLWADVKVYDSEITQVSE